MRFFVSTLILAIAVQAAQAQIVVSGGHGSIVMSGRAKTNASQPVEPLFSEVKPAPKPKPEGPLPDGWSVQMWSSASCGPCQSWIANELPKLAPLVTVFSASANRSEARRLGVQAYPTIMLVDSANMIRTRWRGYVSAETIQQKAHELAGDAKAQVVRYQRKSTQRWNVNGDWSPTRDEVISHLLKAHPRAAATFTLTQLHELPLGDLIAIHDDAHNGAFQ